MAKLTKTVVDAAQPGEKQFIIWCGDLKGFGVCVLPSGTRTYVVDYRTSEDVRRRMTIGRHGKITTEEARKLAIGILGEAVRGGDPAGERATRRKSMTVSELCKQYVAAMEKGLILGKGGRPKKASTIYTDTGRINAHIVPLLGTKRVIDLKAADIKRFLKDVAAGKTAKTKRTAKHRGKSIVRGGNGTATRTTGLLGGILTYAFDEGIIERSPALGVKKPAGKKKKRRLSPEEFAILGATLRQAQAEGECQQLLDAVWITVLSGCRRGEVINLKWSEVDVAGCELRLDDSKEGESVRPAGARLLERLRQIARVEGCETVLVPARAGEVFGGLPNGWLRLAKRAGFTDVTLHTLRHSFASVAADLGYSEPTIGSMLGHSSSSITGRYIHQLDAVLIAAADRVANAVFEMMCAPVKKPEEASNFNQPAQAMAA
ncbi:site-specific integrase [Sphingomonas sp. LM7]|uniref:tyrosine-type recombinase/integrase n=1 Tax=Sphingomonas sp. LM7 TaxID=1938607 RepID=UPI00098406C3|nr:site-specific integrase [Sphingomonas sp. LM7]AQR75079.1 integrase [Sphingomonas sp. LM7]